jgi:pyruvate formate-lyase activating enzyme-like uncharacterized protein
MSKLEELENWIDNNSILVEFSTNGIKFIADLRRKLSELKASEGEERYVVFTNSEYEEGMAQLSNTLKSLDSAKSFCEAWKEKSTWIYKEVNINPPKP